MLPAWVPDPSFSRGGTPRKRGVTPSGCSGTEPGTSAVCSALGPRLCARPRSASPALPAGAGLRRAGAGPLPLASLRSAPRLLGPPWPCRRPACARRRGRRSPRWAALRRRPGGRRRPGLAAWPAAPAGLVLALRLAVAALRASCGRPGCVPACPCASPRPRVPPWRPAAWARSRRLLAAWAQSWPPLRPLCGLALLLPPWGLRRAAGPPFKAPAPGRQGLRSRAIAAPLAPPGGCCVLLPGGGGVCGCVSWGLAAPSFWPPHNVPIP